MCLDFIIFRSPHMMSSHGGATSRDRDLLNDCQAAYYMVFEDLCKNITSREQLQDGEETIIFSIHH